MKNRAVLVAVGLLSLGLCVSAQFGRPQPQYGENYALIIGAPTFGPDGKVTAEPEGPKNDALSVARLIQEKFGFKKENVAVLTGAEAVPERISSELRRVENKLFRTRGSSGHILVYVSDRNEQLRQRGGSAGSRGLPEEIAANNEALRKQGDAEVHRVGDYFNDLLKKETDQNRSRVSELSNQIAMLSQEVAQLRAENLKMADQLGITKKLHSSPVFVGPGRTVDWRELLGSVSRGGAPVLLVFDTPHFMDWLPSRYEYYSSNAEGRGYPVCLLGPEDSGVSKDAVSFDGVEHGAFTGSFLKALNTIATNPRNSSGFWGSGECRTLQRTIYPRSYGRLATEQLPQGQVSPLDVQAFERQLRGGKFFSAPSTGGRELASAGSPFEEELASLATTGGYGIRCEPSQASYRAGERTVLNCEAPADGYVAVLSYGEGDAAATLLLPNRYQPSAKVSKGLFQIPAENERWGVQNSLPPGADRQQQAMVVLFSETPIDPTSLGSPAGIFRNLSAGDTRAMRSQTIVPASYDAAMVQFPIVK